MNQVATKKEGALATFDMEADANKELRIYRRKILRYLS